MDIARKLKPQHLRLIVAIAETGKLQLAAEALGLSQPAASRLLAAMEADIGAPLFERSALGMRPTHMGTAFVTHAHAILNGFADLQGELVGLGSGDLGEVRIGAVTGPAVRSLVPAVLAVKAQAPGIEPTLEERPSTDLFRRLEQGDLDFVLARLPHGHDSRRFQIRPARTEIVSLLVHHTHPLVGRDSVSLNDLTGFPWTVQERGSPIRDALEAGFVAARLEMPVNIINSSSLLVMLGLLDHSQTIATLVDEVAGLLAQDGTLRALPLDRTITVSPYHVIKLRDRRLSRAAERVLDEVLRRL